jgi:16S rRNA (uracil1498-N3)-methyltransferase
MPIARFFVEPLSIDEQRQTIALTGAAQIKQIRSVLRLREGDRLDLLDGQGKIYRCQLGPFADESGRRPNLAKLTCLIESIEVARGEPSINLTVALPLLRHNRFEWALEKLTEIGATTIVPIVLERTVVQLGGADKTQAQLSNKMERWVAIAREAAEQCERALIPNVVSPQKFADFVKNFAGGAVAKFIAAERTIAPPLVDVSDNISDTSICIAIGAEGGFTDEEIALSFTHGFAAVSLGKRILRAETAALYAATILLSRLDR